MDLFLFCVFLGLSLILVTLGLIKSTEHAELSLIGFFFLFLLSLTIINQNIDYNIGSETNTTYFYTGDGNLSLTQETTILHYDTFTLGSTNSHRFGYWLAIGSAVGFVAVLLGFRRPKY